MSQVYVCPDGSYDASTGTCTAGVWVDASSLTPIPPLDADSAHQIGFGIVAAWIAGAVWRWIGQALDAY